MDLITKTVTITGINAILMHSTASMDPSNPIGKAMKAITKKHASKKTDEDIVELQRLEFEAGMYFDDKVGPYIPSEMMFASIRDGGKAQRLGSEVTRSILLVEEKIPLQYVGPRTLKGLWKGGFYDTRSVKVGASRIMRTRPCFPSWSAEFSVQFDPDHLDPDQLDFCILNAGARVGLGDYRPRFGRFSAVIK